MRIALGIEIHVHVLQHIFNTYLLTVSYAPNGIERKALGNTRLKDKHGSSTRSTDKIGSLGIKRGNGFGKNAMVMAVEQTNAVGAYQSTLIFIASVKYFLFQFGAFLGLFAKARRDNDKGTNLFFAGQIFHIVGTETGGHHQYGQVGRGDILHVVERLYPLHLVFLWIDDTQASIALSRKSTCWRNGKTAFYKISNECATRLMHIVGTADNDDAFWL